MRERCVKRICMKMKDKGEKHDMQGEEILKRCREDYLRNVTQLTVYGNIEISMRANAAQSM